MSRLEAINENAEAIQDARNAAADSMNWGHLQAKLGNLGAAALAYAEARQFDDRADALAENLILYYE